MSVDLSTTYLGLRLANPLVPSASPLSSRLEGLVALAEAGAAAVVLPSLFEEQIDLEHELRDHVMSHGSESFAEALSYFPKPERFAVGVEQYQQLVSDARKALDIPIIASLNGSTIGGWVDYAQKLEKAGAHALELNLYAVPGDIDRSGAEVEQNYIDIVTSVRSRIHIPLAVKISPFFSSPGHMAKALCDAGANGLVIFNRFYQSDFDIEELEVVPRLELSRAYDMLMPLTWISMLYGRIPADLAMTSGVQSHLEVLKAMMAGARVAQMASQLLHYGNRRLGEILNSLRAWMEEREYHSIVQMQGSMSQARVAEPSAFLRANYVKVLQSWRSPALR